MTQSIVTDQGLVMLSERQLLYVVCSVQAAAILVKVFPKDSPIIAAQKFMLVFG